MEVKLNERTARMVINAMHLPGDERVGQAVAMFGALAAVKAWQAGVGPKKLVERVQNAIADLPNVLAKQDQLGVNFLIPSDQQWPMALSDLDLSMPVGLWVRGNSELSSLCKNSLAIVGARAATSYGERIASELGTLAADNNQAVISGAAFGIDGSAHRGALVANGNTVAVLACGVDVAYPNAHQGLLERIAHSGSIISEAPLGAPPHKQHFLIRNRLIAALAQQTVIVEAALRSGAVSTANWANVLGRRVWGVPGPITSASSAGVHREIALGQAMLLMSPAVLFQT